MHLFLGWREMEDRLSAIGDRIESFLWGDSRAHHTYLLACTDEHPMVIIEIDIGDHARGIRKSMRLKIREIDEIPDRTTKLEFIGESSSPTALENLIQLAQTYVREHPRYNTLVNNCRTFVEYIIGQIPEFRDSVPQKHGSILEYYHSQEKHDHPGALLRSKEHLKAIHALHCHNRQYKYASHLVLNLQLGEQDDDEEDSNQYQCATSHLVLNVQLPKQNNEEDGDQVIETRH